MQKYKNIYEQYFTDKDLMHNKFPEYAKKERAIRETAKRLCNQIAMSLIPERNIDCSMAVIEVLNSNSIESIDESISSALISINIKSKSNVKPLATFLMKNTRFSKELSDELFSLVIYDVNHENRFLDAYGIYDGDIKIYEPILNKHLLEKEVDNYFKKAVGGQLSSRFLSHIWFEKIHPYVDGNGRVGRSLLSASIKKWVYGVTNKKLSSVIPLSWSLNKNLGDYYSMLSSENVYLTKFFDCLEQTLNKMSEYVSGLEIIYKKQLNQIDDLLQLENEPLLKFLASSSSFSLKNISKWFKLEKEYVIEMMNKLNKHGLFNVSNLGRSYIYINVEHEQLLHTMFN